MKKASVMLFNMAVLAIAIGSSNAYATVISEDINTKTNNINIASDLRCNPPNCNCLPPDTGTTVLPGLSPTQGCSSRDPNRACLRFDKPSTCGDFCSSDVRNCRKPNANVAAPTSE